MQQDFANLLESLKENPEQGADFGKGLHKVRMAISSKGKGKSGGARVITLTALISKTDADIILLTIYEKACQKVVNTIFWHAFSYMRLLLRNTEPVHVCPTAIICFYSRARAEHADFSANPLSFSCLERNSE